MSRSRYPRRLLQPAPDAVTIRDLLVETALQSRVSILDLTTHVPGKRATTPVVHGRTAFAVVARDALSYTLADVARFLNRPVTTVSHLVLRTAPRLSRNRNYQSLVKHLDLFARGLPTTRLDLSVPMRPLPPVLLPAVMELTVSANDKMLRLWLSARAQAHADKVLVTVSDLKRTAADVGVAASLLVRLLARHIDLGLLRVHASDGTSVTYELGDVSKQHPVLPVGQRETAMAEQLLFWRLHGVPFQGIRLERCWPITQITFQQIDLSTTCDPQRWSRSAADVGGDLLSIDAGLMEDNGKPVAGQSAGEDYDRMAELEARRGWNRMARRYGLPREPQPKRLNEAVVRRADGRFRDLRGRMNWGLYLDRIGKSAYLRGDNPTGFVADYRWSLVRTNMLAVLAGVYDDGHRVRLTKAECAKLGEVLNHESVHRDREPGSGPGGARDNQRGEGGQPAAGAHRALHGSAGAAAGEDPMDQGLRVWPAGGAGSQRKEGVEVLRHRPVPGAHVD